MKNLEVCGKRLSATDCAKAVRRFARMFNDLQDAVIKGDCEMNDERTVVRFAIEGQAVISFTIEGWKEPVDDGQVELSFPEEGGAL